MNKLISTLAVIMTLSCFATANADDYRNINQQASRLRNKSKQLLRQSRIYEHTALYGPLKECLLEMESLASHIRELVRHEASIFHVESDLNDLDRLFHRIQGVYQEADYLASRGYGSIQRCPTNVRKLVVEVEQCIHYMQDDVAAIRAAQVRVSQRRSPYSPNVRTPVPQGYPGYNQSVVSPRINHKPAVYQPQVRPRPTPQPPRYPTHRGQRYGYGNGGYNNGGGITIGNGNFRVTFGF